MKKTTTLAALLICLAFCFTACKKDPVTGPTGPAGKDGNANVQSVKITVGIPDWYYASSDKSYNASLNVGLITQKVLDQGLVMVYLGEASGKEWAALPLSYINLQFSYVVSLYTVGVSITTSDLSNLSNPGVQFFKVVVIPPAARVPGIDHSNYQEVKNAYHLVD